MKLSNKIMLSYMVLLVISFVLASSFASTMLSARLKSQAREDLNTQADAIVESLVNAKFQLDQPRRIVSYMNLSNVTTLIPAEIFILNAKRQVVFASNEAVSREELLAVISGESDEYVASYRTLNDGEETIGYLLLTSRVENVQTYITTLRRSLFMGMVLALTVGGILAIVMRKSIVKPIVSLKQDIEKNIENPEYDVRPIETGDEIEDLYKAYTAMNHSIVNHLDERKRYFQNASHELKSPLMSIQGYAEAIRDGVVEGEEVSDSLDIIINKSQQLKKTVEEIIYLSKLANDDFEYTFESLDLKVLIAVVLEDQQMVAAEKGIRLVQENKGDGFRAKLDRTKFESVIENLISNALRYADTIVKTELVSTDDQILIRVMDDGPGLKEGEDQKVFERFYKGEGGNSGIGLAIVREIVTQHGATIRAGNHISGGAVFEVVLPKVQI